nr:immunoglobulin heavy chain junction region [Mus musculus]
CARDYGAYW